MRGFGELAAWIPSGATRSPFNPLLHPERNPLLRRMDSNPTHHIREAHADEHVREAQDAGIGNERKIAARRGDQRPYERQVAAVHGHAGAANRR